MCSMSSSMHGTELCFREPSQNSFDYIGNLVSPNSWLNKAHISSCGEICRNNHASFLECFVENFSVTSAFDAELSGAMRAVNLPVSIDELT